MSLSLLAVHQGGAIGGAPVSLLKQLVALAPDEFRAAAIFTEPGPVLSYARDLGVDARVIPTGGAFFYSAHAHLGPRSLGHFVRTFPGAVRLARATLRHHRPDVLHLNTSVLLAWAAAARRERVPIVWVVREVLGPTPWLRAWHSSFILRHARQVVAISDAVRARFPSGAPVLRVYNAVDLAEFRLDLLARAAAVRSELGLSPGAQVVMAIGAVQRPKGHWLLLDTLHHLPDPVHLVLLTGGADAAYASSMRGRIKRALNLPLDNLDALLRHANERGLTHRIRVTGFRSDVARVLAAADVLAFPSLEPEGFGRPIIEAMALARPVVATDIGPSAELLGTEAGRLVPPDAAHLADALAELLDSPEERSRMGRAGRARVESCFTLERQVAEMSAVYRRAVASA
jgi:glycosyltransferase involved in cell wall biosynthesis